MTKCNVRSEEEVNFFFSDVNWRFRLLRRLRYPTIARWDVHSALVFQDWVWGGKSRGAKGCLRCHCSSPDLLKSWCRLPEGSWKRLKVCSYLSERWASPCSWQGRIWSWRGGGGRACCVAPVACRSPWLGCCSQVPSLKPTVENVSNQGRPSSSRQSLYIYSEDYAVYLMLWSIWRV